MIAILDANILLRLSEPASPQYPTADNAIAALRRQQFELRTVPQPRYEFWVVATRPLANNGLGLSTQEASVELAKLENFFPLINDTPGLFAEWRALVVAHDCKGKVAHDARLVAAMRTHALSHLLTFNVADFARFPGLTILDPAVVIAGSTIAP